MTSSAPDLSDLRALFVNCTLKRSPEPSHTQRLMDDAVAVMRTAGVEVEVVRAVDLDLPAGVQMDMREHGYDADDWPSVQEKVFASDILVLGTPIWLGEKSSVCTQVVERLYGFSAELNDKGQSKYYGRTGGVLVTGNEDGIKHVAMNVLYSLGHLGFTIPPQADAGWIGEAGPGPSFGDDGEVGLDNDFTKRNTTIMCWNLMHTAKLLKDAGGLPAHGNDRNAWADGEHFGHPR